MNTDIVANVDSDIVPSVVFIIPYRDRLAQKEFFLRYMSYILEDYDETEYRILFCHQQDKRVFNRGAMKNAGFIYVKNNYPTQYQKITLVFHDIDCVPYIKNLLDYKTAFGKIKHFYGFEYALGGIVSITCYDFEKINGFPNYWGWGFEDNALQNRATRHGKYISRKTFFKIGDNRILHLFDTFKKESDKNIPNLFLNEDGSTGVSSISQLNTKIVDFDIIMKHSFLNVSSFETEFEYNEQNIIQRDIREENNIEVKSNKVTSRNVTKKNTMAMPIIYETNEHSQYGSVPSASNSTNNTTNGGQPTYNKDNIMNFIGGNTRNEKRCSVMNNRGESVCNINNTSSQKKADVVGVRRRFSFNRASL